MRTETAGAVGRYNSWVTDADLGVAGGWLTHWQNDSLDGHADELRSLGLSVAIGQVRAAGAVSPQARDGLDDLLQLPVALAQERRQAKPVHSCEILSNSRLSDDATVREARIAHGKDGTGDWCRVTIEIAAAPASRVITVWVMLPIEQWNGRFLGLGGGGWVPGVPAALGAGAALGFATAITDAGHPYDLSIDPEELGRMIGRDDFLTDADGRLDSTALQDFGYRGIREMTVAGKAVTKEFYGTAPNYSYFSGCSTRGR